MTNEKITETTPATATEKKANAKKEGKNTMTTPATAPAMAEIETKKAEITAKISELLTRGKEVKKIDDKANSLNATNWGKDTTSTGNETLGRFVRGLLKQYADEIAGLKRDLKCLYFTLDPVLNGLLTNENALVVDLVKACIENMRNVAIISVDDYYRQPDYYNAKREPKKDINQNIVEALKVLAGAGVERVGVAPELLGVAIPLLAVEGYVFESITQPVTIEEKQIAGLDKIPACTYYSFKKM